jgi:hypothetical protein
VRLGGDDVILDIVRYVLTTVFLVMIPKIAWAVSKSEDPLIIFLATVFLLGSTFLVGLLLVTSLLQILLCGVTAAIILNIIRLVSEKE